ncbi:unnamed protein product, partial [Pylaiella littoralis]
DDFDSIAKRTGFYRRLTSLLSNYILARRIEQGLDLPEINKKFYDQVWSSLTQKDDEWTLLYEEFVAVCGFRTGDFPCDVKTRTKESVTNEMATVAKTMITGMLESKLRSHVRRRLEDKSNHFLGLDRNQKERATSLVVRHVLDLGFQSHHYLDIHGDYGNVIRPLRLELSGAYSESVNTGKPLYGVINVKPHLFLKVLSYINNHAEIKSNEQILLKKKERSSRSVKVSSLPPVFDLQPAFVYYSDSVIKVEFRGHDILSLMAESFRYDNINMKGYTPYGFRTNGVEIHIAFMTEETERPYISGTKDLNKAGYKITAKNVDVLTQKRGLFEMHQSKTDAKRVRDPARINITSVDPGCSSVVSVRKVHLEKCSSPVDIHQDDAGNTWDLLGKEYSKTSGRTSGQTRERRRTMKCLTYRRAIKKFEGVRRKTSSVQSIIAYCRVVANTLKDLYREKNRKNRRVFWIYKSRRTRSTVDKLANPIAFYKEQRKNVVLFGNGFLKAKKGHASCPRKILVGALASRALVGMLDEYRTSKRCPGGCRGDMKDIEENLMRRCTADLGNGEDNFCCDRDRSATINLCRIGYESLVNNSWPEHLARATGS